MNTTVSLSTELDPDGYRTPLRTSLTRPILMGGVPRNFAILNATVAAAIGFGLQQPFIAFPLWTALQGAAAWAAARDPWFLDTWPRHMAKPHFSTCERGDDGPSAL